MGAPRIEDTFAQKVTFEKDRVHIFKDLSTGYVPLRGQAATDDAQFSFKITKLERDIFYVERTAQSARSLIEGEAITISFALGEGQFFLKTKVHAVLGISTLLPVTAELYRVQRRNNFRTYIPERIKVTAHVTALNTAPCALNFPLVDISAGGGCFEAQSAPPELLSAGDKLELALAFDGREPLELKAEVRHIAKTAGGSVRVGVEFRDLRLSDEQQLLALSMQIHRQIFALFRE